MAADPGKASSARARAAAAALAALVSLSPAGAPAAAESAVAGPRAPGEAARWVEGRIVVRYRAASGVAHAAAAAGVRETLGAAVERTLGRGAIEVLRLPAGLGVPAAVAAARRDPRVAVAEPDYLYRLADAPDDPLYPQQWALENLGQDTVFMGSRFASGGYVDADADATAAWALPADGSGTVVAVVDTGIETTHPDLAAALWTNPGEIAGNGLDDDGNGWVDDVHGIDAGTPGSGDPLDDIGHGTHVAGIIAAQRGNGAGVAGLAPGAKVVAVKIFTRSGEFSFTSLTAILAGLEYVRGLRAAGVPVVATNNSWGGGAWSELLEEEIGRHAEAGILFVAAAGNDYTDNDASSFFPASYGLPNVISVAATTNRDEPASFTNVGRRTVDLGAPGRTILSTVSKTSLYTNGGEEYVPLSGTSMAAPHVTAVAALVAGAHPALAWWGVRNLILSSGDPLPELAGLTLTGRRLDAGRAVACSGASLLAGLEPATPPAAGSTAVVRALSVSCAAAAGPVVATLPGGVELPLRDDGAAPDEVAGDGCFAAFWENASPSGAVVFASPLGTDTLGVAPRVTMADLPTAWVGHQYSRPLQVSAGLAPFSWSVTEGALPPGLQVVEVRDGRTNELYWHRLEGTPTQEGTWTFTLTALDAAGAVFAGPVTVRVGRRLDIGPRFLPEANPAWPYATGLVAANAAGPVAWSIPVGRLPDGLALDPTAGTIAGSVAAVTEERFIVRAQDGSQPRQERTLRLRSVDGPVATGFGILEAPEGPRLNAVAAYPDGGSVAAGSTRAPNYWDDALLARFDARGALLWKVTHDGPAQRLDDFSAVAVGPDGTVYAAGSETAAQRNAFLAAYAPDGTRLWSRSWAGASSAQAVEIAIDAEGRICVAVTLLWGMGALRYLPDGTLDWATMASTAPATGATARGIAIDAEGTVHVVGWYRPDGITNATAVASFSPAGAYLGSWGWTMAEDVAAAAIVALPGPVLGIAGDLRGEGFVATFTTGGTPIWFKRESWPGRDVSLYALAADSRGGLVATGVVSWRPDPEREYLFDSFAVRYGADGSRSWGRTWDLSEDSVEIALGVSAAPDGFLVLGVNATLGGANAGLVVKVLDPGGAADADGDGVPLGPDCDDADAAVHPGAPESCDGRDESCDGVADEGFDADGDGFTSCGGDCDDADPAAHPGAAEVCNGNDDDCDGVAEAYLDADGDGVATCAGDCDDADPAAFPGAPELRRDGVDQDCNGHDLTIRGRAVWDRSAKALWVVARSDLGAAAALRVASPPRPLRWNAAGRAPRWERLVRRVLRRPAAVTVVGVEGSVALPLTVVP